MLHSRELVVRRKGEVKPGTWSASEDLETLEMVRVLSPLRCSYPGCPHRERSNRVVPSCGVDILERSDTLNCLHSYLESLLLVQGDHVRGHQLSSNCPGDRKYAFPRSDVVRGYAREVLAPREVMRMQAGEALRYRRDFVAPDPRCSCVTLLRGFRWR